MTTKPITLMLCCNRGRSGAFAGTCSRVALTGDDERLTLETPFADAALKCRIEPATFGLGARRNEWRHLGFRRWCGNMAWDAVLVTPATAADVLNFAVGKGYRPMTGIAHLFEKAERREPLTVIDLLSGWESR